MISVEELKRKLDEITTVLTKLPENSQVSSFSCNYYIYDKYENGEASKPIIGKLHNFSINVSFDEIFEKSNEEKLD